MVWGFIILDFGVGSRLLTYTRIYPAAGGSVSDFSYRVAPQDFFFVEDSYNVRFDLHFGHVFCILVGRFQL